jgi:hypothetical protein
MILTPKNWKSFQHYKERTPSWIKLHKGLLTDFEFVRLPMASRALAPMLWLLASEYEGGSIDASLEKIAFRVHMRVEDLQEALSPLIDAGFFETSEVLAKPLAGCLPREEDIGKRKEEKIPTPAKPQARASDEFQRFKKAFPRRDGANPWHTAEKKFNALVKTGVDPEVMIRAAAELAREEGARGNIGTKFIPQAITWLNQQRFQDYAVAAFDDAKPFDWEAVFISYTKFKHWSRDAGPDPTSPACRAPVEILRKYGFEPVIPALRAM